MDFYVFSFLCLLSLCVRLFICALWSSAGKGLTAWLSFVVYNCEFVTFPLVSWNRYQLFLKKSTLNVLEIHSVQQRCFLKENQKTSVWI